MDEIEHLREEYEAALDEVEEKRAAYHQAIRKLHMGGMPLREIAKNLGISHQRVHQIVGVEAPRKKRRFRGKTIGGAILLVLLLAVGTATAIEATKPYPWHEVRPYGFVMMEDDARPSDIERLRQVLRDTPGVDEVRVYSPRLLGSSDRSICRRPSSDFREILASIEELSTRPPGGYIIEFDVEGEFPHYRYERFPRIIRRIQTEGRNVRSIQPGVRIPSCDQP